MRAMVSPALPALTVLTASIERLGQSCARAAGAKMIRTAHATAPHHVRNDIDTSLECGRSSVDFVGRIGMMPPIGARTQPAARPLRACVARGSLTPPGPAGICAAAVAGAMQCATIRRAIAAASPTRRWQRARNGGACLVLLRLLT